MWHDSSHACNQKGKIAGPLPKLEMTEDIYAYMVIECLHMAEYPCIIRFVCDLLQVLHYSVC